MITFVQTKTSLYLYKKDIPSNAMEYMGIGSGNGQKAIINNVDIEYAGSDSNLPESTKTLYPDLIEFPTIAG